MPGANNLTGYQVQLITPKVSNFPKDNNSTVSNTIEKPDPSKRENDDTVRISQKAKELEQTYQNKENSIEQKFDAKRQELEKEYVQQKTELEREFARKKQSLNVNLYV